MMRQSCRSLAIAVLVLVVSGSGCTIERGWTKAGAAEADFNRDSYECAREATLASRRAAIVDGSSLSRGEAKSDKDLYRACMRARGYQLIDGGHWRGFRDCSNRAPRSMGVDLLLTRPTVPGLAPSAPFFEYFPAALYRQAASRAEDLGMRRLVAHCHLGLGKLYLRTDKREQAREHLATWTTMHGEMGMT
jgi:hypothetical protein